MELTPAFQNEMVLMHYLLDFTAPRELEAAESQFDGAFGETYVDTVAFRAACQDDLGHGDDDPASAGYWVVDVFVRCEGGSAEAFKLSRLLFLGYEASNRTAAVDFMIDGISKAVEADEADGGEE